MIDAEAKSKILQANISNIVRKVKSGKPLSQPEIALLERASEEGPTAAKEIEETINGETLTKLTTLTDRRHRQLADEGFFPKPERGRYKTTATIQGIIRYYKQQADNTENEEQLERRTRLQADLLQIEKDEAEGKLLPIAHVETAWEFIIVNLRQRIWHHVKLTEDIKRDLLTELKNIPINDYRPSENDKTEEET